MFSHDEAGIMSLGEEYHRGELSSLPQIRNTWDQHDIAPRSKTFIILCSVLDKMPPEAMHEFNKYVCV